MLKHFWELCRHSVSTYKRIVPTQFTIRYLMIQYNIAIEILTQGPGMPFGTSMPCLGSQSWGSQNIGAMIEYCCGGKGGLWGGVGGYNYASFLVDLFEL